MKSLRTSYITSKKPSPSGSSRKNLSKRASWLAEKLQFLEPFDALRAPISSMDLEICDTQTSGVDEIDEELDKVDDSIGQKDSDSETPGPSSEEATDIQYPKSAKVPIKIKQSRQKQVEEEFKLMKNLAVSIGERKSKKAKLDNQNNGESDVFGSYVVHALSELDPATRILAQHEINNILFEAQTGRLKNKHSVITPQPTSVIQPQQQAFLPIFTLKFIPRPLATSSSPHFIGINSPSYSIPSIETRCHRNPQSSTAQYRGYVNQGNWRKVQ